ncbi:MAG: GNAT family N-acetyltransferase [Lachnospiraceae bacterium]|nr:GNAT family N-acetyltransferase [Lachnospiraceae bacterium]
MNTKDDSRQRPGPVPEQQETVSAPAPKGGLLAQIAKFGLVGVFCFVVDYVIYRVCNGVFEGTGLAARIPSYYLVSAACGFTVSVVVNYLLSMRFVFTRRQDMSRGREFVIFVILSIIGLAVNEICMFVGMDLIYAGWAWIRGLMSYDFAKDVFFKFGATGVVMVYNFITRKLFLEGGNRTLETTDPVTLTPVTEQDTEDILRWRNASFVKEHFILRDDLTAEGHARWLTEQIGTGKAVQFVIREPSGRGIGSVYLRDVDHEKKQAEYGVFIGEQDALGKGYGAWACKKMLSYAFDTMGLKIVYLRVYADNDAAIGSYKKAGFVEKEILKDVESTDGEIKDMIRMEVRCEKPSV